MGGTVLLQPPPKGSSAKRTMHPECKRQGGTRTGQPLERRAGRGNFIALPTWSLPLPPPSPAPHPSPSWGRKAALHPKGQAPLARHFFIFFLLPHHCCHEGSLRLLAKSASKSKKSTSKNKLCLCCPSPVGSTRWMQPQDGHVGSEESFAPALKTAVWHSGTSPYACTKQNNPLQAARLSSPLQFLPDSST